MIQLILDAIAVFEQSGGICIAILSVRGGRGVLGVNSQFPDAGLLETPEEILDAFIPRIILLQRALFHRNSFVCMKSMRQI